MKQFIILLFLTILTFSGIQAQATFKKWEKKTVYGKEMIHVYYDLANTGNGFFDVTLIAYIDDVRVVASQGAVAGDVGKKIRHGKKKKIVWDVYVDLVNMDGNLRFEIQAEGLQGVPPPTPITDYAIAGSAGGLGLILGIAGLSTTGKKGNVDLSADPDSDPITYYYTFCDPDSPSFDSEKVVIGGGSTSDQSLCDDHFAAANKKYKNGRITTLLGVVLITGGAYFYLKKPIFAKKMSAWNRKYGIQFDPIIDLSPGLAQDFSQTTIGLRMTLNLNK